ncbi:MAG: DUF134 domain-containing protein [Anaerolineales bacterium]
MPRPRKRRRVWHEPKPAVFKPVGVPLDQLGTITLLHEELEALRLVDLEGRYQEDAAEQMNVSRSTLQRIVNEARHKVVQALTDGAALQIEGGTFRVARVWWQCNDCGYLWELEHGSGQGAPMHCPSCKSRAIRLRRRRKHRTPGIELDETQND